MMRSVLALALIATLVVAVSADASARSHRSNRPSLEATPTPSPTPSESPSPRSSPSEDPFPEPDKPGFFDLVGKVRYAISQWFSNLVTSALRPVFDFLGRTVFSTPPLADNDRIVQLWGVSLAIADSLLLLLFLVGAGLVTVGGGLGSQITAKELLPRLLLAAIAANVSLLLLRWLIELSNALSAAVLGASLEPAEVARLMIRLLANAALQNPFLALLGLAAIVLAVLVVIVYIIRVAVLVVLAAGAPLLLIGHTLPQTERWARAWWRATLALLVAPVAQSLLLAAAFRVLLTSDGVLGLPIGSGFIDILVVGTLLYFLFKVPFWMLHATFSGAESRAIAQARRIGSAVTKAVAAA
jgi:Conjugal transfer protein TrbL